MSQRGGITRHASHLNTLNSSGVHYLEGLFGDHMVSVCGSERGMCHVFYGSRNTVSANRIRAHGQIEPMDSPALKHTLESVLRFLQTGDDRSLKRIKLDIRGTEFQMKVWNAIRMVRRGSTETYSSLARRIGNPGAARAVGSACASNPVPFIIPCHRILPRSGEPGHYGLGTNMKRYLLRMEHSDR